MCDGWLDVLREASQECYASPMRYVEERELVIRLHLRAEFPDDYEGERDGYEWYRAFDQKVRPELLRELLQLLAGRHGYRVTPVNRGLDTHEEIELRVECGDT